MRGECVPEGMRVYAPQTRGAGDLRQSLPENDSINWFTGTGNKYEVAGKSFHRHQARPQFPQITFDGRLRRFADGNDAFLKTFTDHANHAQIRMQIRKLKSGKFAGPESAGVKQFDNGLVAQPQRMFWINCFKQRVDLRAV